MNKYEVVASGQSKEGRFKGQGLGLAVALDAQSNPVKHTHHVSPKGAVPALEQAIANALDALPDGSEVTLHTTDKTAAKEWRAVGRCRTSLREALARHKIRVCDYSVAKAPPQLLKVRQVTMHKAGMTQVDIDDLRARRASAREDRLKDATKSGAT